MHNFFFVYEWKHSDVCINHSYESLGSPSSDLPQETAISLRMLLTKTEKQLVVREGQERQKICSISSCYLYRVGSSQLQLRSPDSDPVCLLSHTPNTLAPSFMRFCCLWSESSWVCTLPCATCSQMVSVRQTQIPMLHLALQKSIKANC